MDKGLSAEAFEKLLERLGNDPGDAGDQYEELRRLLTRFFEWRGARHSEDLTDETINRVARRLADGIEINNIRAYCHEVGRLVFLESLRSRDAKGVPLDAVDYEISAPDDSSANREKEARMECLDECLGELSPDGRLLITEYYKDDKRARIDHRQQLAARLGLRRDALANRAQRLRDKLEKCVKKCVKKND